MKTNLILCISVFSLFFGCKSSTTTLDPINNTILITGATWQPAKVFANVGVTITAYTKGGNGNLMDFSKFRLALRDGKYDAIDNLGNTSSGTWKFTNNEKSFELTDAITSEVISWDITTLTATTLNVSHTLNITKPSTFDRVLIDYGKGIGVAVPAGAAMIVELIP